MSRSASPAGLDEYRHYLFHVASLKLAGRRRAAFDPDDAVQETLLKAHRSRAAFHGETADEFRAWLRRILVNVIVTQSQRRALPVTAAIDLNRLPATAGGDADAIDEYRRAYSGLSDVQRQVVELRCAEGRTFAEIGRVVGRTSDATRMLWRRTLVELRTAAGAKR